MGATVLSKLQMKCYQEIVEAFGESNKMMISPEKYLRLQDVLDILAERGYIVVVPADEIVFCIKQGDFADFEEWLDDEAREARKLSRREWKIAIISAVVGALIGLLPTIIPWVISLFTMDG